MIANTTTGLAGAMYAVYLGSVSPEITSPARIADPVVVTILGGTGTLYGPIVGAVCSPAFKDVISRLIGNWELFVGFMLRVRHACRRKRHLGLVAAGAREALQAPESGAPPRPRSNRPS